MASKRNWALVLGASSGFGEAVSLALARTGRNIFGVHLDRKQTLPNVDRIKGEIEKAGTHAVFFNMNAADHERRAEALAEMATTLEADGNPHGIDVVLHSLAFGTLKPFLGDAPSDRIAPAQMEMTLDVMAHSLVYWAGPRRGRAARRGRAHLRDDVRGRAPHLALVRGRVGREGGARKPLPAARRRARPAEDRRERDSRGRHGHAGAPEDPGQRENDRALPSVHPAGRLTMPEDVGRVIAAMARPETVWMTGNVLGVDGAEDIVG